MHAVLYRSHPLAGDGGVLCFNEASMSHGSDIPLFRGAVSWSALGACAVAATLCHFDTAPGARKQIFRLANVLYVVGVAGTVFSISAIHGSGWYVAVVLHAILAGIPLVICTAGFSRQRREREVGRG